MAISLLTASHVAADQSIIVLDASGSMWGQIEGKTKIEIARDTLGTVLSAVPASNELGLIVYGHREKGSCGDIELAVPPGKGTGKAISDFVKSINPKGKTPLSASVRKAAEELKFTEEKATVILVTDGLETCEADPCALGQELERSGVDFTAHVVGFGLTDDEGKQVACLAENTGGKYLQAKDASELSEALTQAVVVEPAPEPAPEPEPAKPEFNVMTDAVMHAGAPSMGDTSIVRWDFYTRGADGKRTEQKVAGAYGAVKGFNLPPGQYVGVAVLRGLKKEVAFDVSEADVAKPSVDFNAANLTIVPKRTPDGEPYADARVDAHYAGLSSGGYGKTELIVAAGDVKIVGKIGATALTETISVNPGENKVHEMVIGSGRVVTKALYASGGPEVAGNDIRFDVVIANADLNGKRPGVAGTFGVDSKLDVPVGHLVLVAKLGAATAETPFSISADEQKDVTVTLNAGVIAVSAPGAYRVEILSAKKDIQGKQQSISGGFDQQYQNTVPAGDYIVRVTYDGDKAPQERPVSVKAGERTEVSVE